MAQPRISVSQSDIVPQITILKFEGDFDTASISRVSGGLRQALEHNPAFLVAEMSEVLSISSAVLGELMGGRKAMVERGGHLVIAGLCLEIKSKLTLMGAHKVFKFFNDVRSAINAYKWEYEGRAEDLCLSFPPVLKFVPLVRQMTSRLAKQKGYSGRDSFRIETIVDEICNNAVEHRRTGSPDNVELSVRIDRKKVEIRVVNESDPEKLRMLKEIMKPDDTAPEKRPAPTADQKRGRGLALVKMLSTRFDVEFSEKGTSVHATKLREE